MLFAFCSILINLGTQYITKILLRNTHLSFIQFYTFQLVFLIQLILGTAAGFIFKFIVDKFLIFKNAYAGIKHTTKQIIIYTLFAIIITIIFWGFEILFKNFFHFHNSELFGGFIGLIIGYTTKFFLDRRWVFNVL